MLDSEAISTTKEVIIDVKKAKKASFTLQVWLYPMPLMKNQ
jgi:hypothetical protein